MIIISRISRRGGRSKGTSGLMNFSFIVSGAMA